MTRSASPSHGLTALLAVALLVLAAGPAAAAVVDVMGNSCCNESCPPPETPAPDATSCCAQAPAAGHDVALAPVPVHDDVLVALVTDPALPRAIPRAHAPPRDTGPPPGLRRHLALSVLLV